MRLFTSLLFLIVISFSLSAQEDVKGKWQTGDDNTVVEIYQKDGAVFGKIISSDNAKATINLDVMKNFICKDGQWNGEIYSLKKKKTYPAAFTLTANVMDIVVDAGITTKEIRWQRMK